MNARRLLVAGALLAVVASQALAADKAGPDRTETRIHHAVTREDAIEGVEYYVHTFVLDLVGLQNPGAWRAGKGIPVYRVVHTSEGPYDGFGAPARLEEIATKGLVIGTHFWPLSSVQRVEIRPVQTPH